MKYIKKIILILFSLSSSILIQAQCIRVENGFGISSFQKHKTVTLFTDNIQRYALLVGIDYLEHKHWSLSSEIGYLTLGGEEKNILVGEEERKDFTESKKYVQVNTTFRVKCNIDNTYFYAGVGPKLDILIESNEINNYLFAGYSYNRFIWGTKTEIGFYQVLNPKIRVGLNASYLLNIGNTMESAYVNQKSKAFILTFSLGCCI